MYEINPFDLDDTGKTIHGGKVFDFARSHRCDPSEILDFSANINPLGLSPLAKAAILENLDDIVHYPDRFCRVLREMLAVQYRLKAGQVLIGNGATELIHLIPRAMGLKKILIPAPSFSEYERAAQLAGAEVVFMPLPEENAHRLDVRVLVDLINDNKNNGIDAVFLCNPNNPTGHLLSKKEVISILKAAFHLGVLVILDEAFIDFTDAPSFVGEIAWYINLIVVRSFTKFYAMPGLRAGYLAANAQTVSQIEAIQNPWSVNHLAAIAAAAGLGDARYVKATHQLIEAERTYLSEALSKLPGIAVFPSSTNYLLFKLGAGTPDADELSKRFGPSKILIRSCESFRGLSDRHVRIAVRTHRENEVLIERLREILGGD
ncbi:MAG: threonine-phosphate decarboxylase [Nitrospirae bacterium]|nr:threonine-phosphate decarboxylase [Candidatus Manganitrophaceae bacterium]